MTLGGSGHPGLGQVGLGDGGGEGALVLGAVAGELGPAGAEGVGRRADDADGGERALRLGPELEVVGGRGLRGEAKKFWRPRLYAYGVAGVVGLVVASFAFRSRTPFEANLIRQPGVPYTHDGDVVRNSFELHLVNKRDATVTYDIRGAGDPDMSFALPMSHVEVAPLGSARVPVVVLASKGGERTFVVHVSGGGAERDAKARLLGVKP